MMHKPRQKPVSHQRKLLEKLNTSPGVLHSCPQVVMGKAWIHIQNFASASSNNGTSANHKFGLACVGTPCGLAATAALVHCCVKRTIDGYAALQAEIVAIAIVLFTTGIGRQANRGNKA